MGLKIVQHGKYLGVIINKKLQWLLYAKIICESQDM